MSITQQDRMEELRREREARGLPADGPEGNGRSITDRAGDEPDPYSPEALNEPEEELFFLDQGRRVTIGKLISQGIPIEYRVTLNAKSVKGGADMGLLSFKDPNIILAVSAREGKVAIDPTYDSETGEVEKATIYVNFKPQQVHDAKSAEGRALLGLGEA